MTSLDTHCISTVRFSVLINDVPSRFFSSSRCLRQRDPLFLLFVVVMKTLSRMMLAIVDRGLFLGLSVGSRNNDELIVSHLTGKCRIYELHNE